MDFILKAQKLSKWYGNVIGINEIDWEFSGGIIGLLGPNGAGKSTLLKLITGQIHLSKGELLVFGKPPFGNASIFQKIGFAPEQDLGYTHLSAFQLLNLTGKLCGFSYSEGKKKSEAALEKVNLLKAKDRPMNTYSKGMRQRVKIARAILHEPDLLVLDEPLTGADPLGRKDLLEFFRNFAEKGKKHIILSSHVLHEVEALTNQIILINRGRIRAQGSVEEIRNLMNEFPHRIAIQLKEPRELASDLISKKHIKGVSILNPHTILVEATDPEKFYQEIPGSIVNTKAEVTEIFSEDDNLEAVFRYLTSGK